MTITIDNYLLEQEPSGILQWNIYRLDTVKKSKNGNNGNVSKTNIAYAVQLPRAIEIVISDSLMDDYREVTLLDYIAEYKHTVHQMTKEVINQLKQQL